MWCITMCALTRACVVCRGSAVTLQQQNIINFPSGTTEMKSAWKLLSAAEVAAGTFCH